MKKVAAVLLTLFAVAGMSGQAGALETRFTLCAGQHKDLKGLNDKLTTTVAAHCQKGEVVINWECETLDVNGRGRNYGYGIECKEYPDGIKDTFHYGIKEIYYTGQRGCVQLHIYQE